MVSLQLSSTKPDGALHVYLEDVAPDGRVTYLTEGVLRLVHGIANDADTAVRASGAASVVSSSRC